jgi:hypothetical protein
MAMEDYLSGSPFGQVAGSLLKRRDRDWKKALGVSVLGSVLQNMNLQKQSDNQKNMERTQEEYDQIFSNNEEIWAAKEHERGLWRGYQAATRRGEGALDSWVDRQAIVRFNEDAHIRSEMGSNAYESLQGDKWNEESKDRALDFFGELRGQLVSEIEGFKEDRAITAPTQTKFNQAALNELNAQLAVYEDDPSKQSVILNTFGNIFGTYDRKRAELSLALRNAQRARSEQEATYQGVTYDENEQIVVQQINNTRRDKFDYTTTAEDTARQLKALKTKMEEDGYILTEEDAIESLSLAHNPISAPNLNALVQSDISGFVETFTLVQSLRDQKPDYDPTDILTGRQRDIYHLGLGLTDDQGVNLLEASENERGRFQASQFILSEIGTEKDRLDTDLGSTSRLLYQLDGDFKIDVGKDASTSSSSVFISHVLWAKEVLMKKYDMPEEKALKEAYDMQVRGIIKEGGFTTERLREKTWRWDWAVNPQDQETHGHEYVSPDAMFMPIVPETAHIAAENFTENKWMQNRGIITSDGRQVDMIPEEGKVRVMVREPSEDFVVTFTAKPDLPLGQTVEMFNTINEEREAREEEPKELEYKWQSSFEYLELPAP